MEEVMKKSTSFLVADESRQASFSPSGHYKITPLHRDTLDFETETPRKARLNYIQTGAQVSEIKTSEVTDMKRDQQMKFKKEETSDDSFEHTNQDKTRSTLSTLERKSSTSSSSSSSSNSSNKSWEII